MTVGERIKKTREEKGITQEELAKIMGYSGKTSVSKIETRGNNITSSTLSKFAKALGVSESFLMGWSDAKFESIVDKDIEVSIDNFSIEMYDITKHMTEEQKIQIINFAKFISDKKDV